VPIQDLCNAQDLSGMQLLQPAGTTVHTGSVSDHSDPEAYFAHMMDSLIESLD